MNITLIYIEFLLISRYGYILFIRKTVNLIKLNIINSTYNV
jgi:hypothetical protein